MKTIKHMPDTPLATDLYVPFTVDATSLAAVHATPAAARGASDANTADKPDPDGAVPDEDSGGQPGPNGYIKALTTKEIEANTTSIAPGEVAGWQEWTLPALAKHTPLWAACCPCPCTGHTMPPSPLSQSIPRPSPCRASVAPSPPRPSPPASLRATCPRSAPSSRAAWLTWRTR